MTAVATLIDFALADLDLPTQTRADAERLLADTLAVGAAGASSPEAVKLIGAVQRWGGGTDARLLSGGTAPAPSAAFFNGFAIHCLEWDAVHEPAVVHALSVVTAALLAASDRRGGSDPQALLSALAIGVDVASGIGLSATGPMKFFRPATAGVLGATLAVARLEGLTRAQATDAFGLAYSFASGTMQAHIEASVALPLQIGNAARSAITAVDLATAGMDGPHDVLTGPLGYARLIEDIDLTVYIADLGKVWRISEVSIKPFPSGRASHGALGALQALCSGESRSPDGSGKAPATGLRLSPEHIASITLHAPPLIHRLVGRPYQPGAPMSYNRLCLAFLAPLMLRDGHIDPRLTATDADLAGRVSVVLDGNPDENALSPQRLVVALKDGSIIERSIPATLGSPAAPMSAAQYASKYALCRDLAPEADARIFDAPLAYATEPR